MTIGQSVKCRPAGQAPNSLSDMWFWSRAAVALGAFAVASAIAGLLGAENLGTALSFGQIAFALTTALLIIRA